MKNNISLDTLQCVEILMNGGFTKEQAEASTKLIKKQTDEFNSLIDSNLATKHDLKNELKILYLKMTITLGSIMLTGLGLIKLLKL